MLPVRRLDAHGVILPTKFATPVAHRKLQLRDDLFNADAIIFDKVASQRLYYGPDDGPQLEIAFPGMPHLGVWTKPRAGFICIEPWHGFADPHDYAGDFSAKPGIALIQPSMAREFVMSLSWLA